MNPPRIKKKWPAEENYSRRSNNNQKLCTPHFVFINIRINDRTISKRQKWRPNAHLIFNQNRLRDPQDILWTDETKLDLFGRLVWRWHFRKRISYLESNKSAVVWLFWGRMTTQMTSTSCSLSKHPKRRKWNWVIDDQIEILQSRHTSPPTLRLYSVALLRLSASHYILSCIHK